MPCAKVRHVFKGGIVSVRILVILLMMTHLFAVDVDLLVGGMPSSGSATYTWSVLSFPDGGTPPILATTSTTTGTNRATFDPSALPGTYWFQASIQDRFPNPVLARTAVQVSRLQHISFPGGGSQVTYQPSAIPDLDPGATTTAPGMRVIYRIKEGTAAVLVGQRLRPVGSGTVVVEADVEAHSPVLYRAHPAYKTFTFTAEANDRIGAHDNDKDPGGCAGGMGLILLFALLSLVRVRSSL